MSGTALSAGVLLLVAAFTWAGWLVYHLLIDFDDDEFDEI